MNKEYIERSAVIDLINGYAKGNYVEARTDSLLYYTNDIPAADVVEMRHGKWHKRLYYRPSTQSYDCEMYACSECGNELSYDAETGMRMCYWNYCPNCGAEMDGERKGGG